MTDNKLPKGKIVSDLTQGNVVKQLLVFAAPLFVSNLLQAVYNIVDMIVIGNVVGGVGMSAVAIGGNILNLLTFLAMGFSSAGQVLIARFVGAKDKASIKKVIGSMFTILLSLALTMTLICSFIRHKLLKLVNTPEESYDLTMKYTIICISGLVFIYGYNIVSAILRGMGDSKRPFYFVAIATSVNLVLDVVFVVYLRLSAMGAAMATVIGQAVSFIFSLVYLYRKKEDFGFDFKLKSFIPDPVVTGRILKLGIPMALQSASITISMTVVAAWVNSFGVISSAIAGVYSKLNSVVGIMANSITTASASMVGQNLGAKKYERVPRILGSAFTISAIIGIICSIVLLLNPQTIFRMFTDDMTVVSSASVIIIPALINMGGCASRTFAFGIINGSGNSKLNLAVAILDGMISRIGLAYFFGFVLEWGPRGFWTGDSLAGFMPIIIGGIYYLTGRWKKPLENR